MLKKKEIVRGREEFYVTSEKFYNDTW